MPDVLQCRVHRLSVLELVFELDALPRHLNADKDTNQSRGELVYQWMSLEQLLTLKTDNRK